MSQPISEATRILGERIRTRRLKLACSQEEIANLAGMNVSNFGKIERGLGNPNFHTLVRIASVLGIDPALLVVKIGADALPDLEKTFTAADFIRERRRREESGR
ncbi:helix-turn-helix domain-containing protein [Lacisediminihabitans sp. FW035]